jgi:hypothetical protein
MVHGFHVSLDPEFFAFLWPPPLPPVWHTFIPDCVGFMGWPCTFSMPDPYRMHTFHTSAQNLPERGRSRAANVYQKINSYSQLFWREFDPNLVQAESIPNDLRAKNVPQGRQFFLFI